MLNDRTAKRVLVVDDDVDLLESMREILENEGYRVTTASDGVEALTALAGDLPDLILLDLAMPRMDGPTFRMRQWEDARTAEIPLVVMTAASSMAERAKPLEPEACLAKPMTVDQLLETVARCCVSHERGTPTPMKI